MRWQGILLVYLFKKYGSTSMREWWRWRQYGQRWRSLLTRTPELCRTPEGRTMLAWHLGRHVGLLKEACGSARLRSLWSDANGRCRGMVRLDCEVSHL